MWIGCRSAATVLKVEAFLSTLRKFKQSRMSDADAANLSGKLPVGPQLM
jgi:hypothetical protein